MVIILIKRQSGPLSLKRLPYLCLQTFLENCSTLQTDTLFQEYCTFAGFFFFTAIKKLTVDLIKQIIVLSSHPVLNLSSSLQPDSPSARARSSKAAAEPLVSPLSAPESSSLSSSWISRFGSFRWFKGSRVCVLDSGLRSES